jgi:uncharacterized surface protein with fasciclin (FAS1) repeats
MKIKSLTVLAAAMLGFSGAAVSQSDRDLLQLIGSKEQFSTLAKAIEAANLGDALRNADSEFTVFAPTNEAFAKLPASDLEALLKPENKDKLVAVLTHHLVAGKGRTIAELPRKRELQSVEGSSIKIELQQGKLRADGAKVGRDFMASNGTVLSIDTVMLPN